MKERRPNIIRDKSKAFALRCIRLYKYLCEHKKEFVMSKQLLRCGTSIGANVTESVYAQSEADFVSKTAIACKEAAESMYWLELLHESGYLIEPEFDSLAKDCDELIAILVSIRKSKANHN